MADRLQELWAIHRRDGVVIGVIRLDWLTWSMAKDPDWTPTITVVEADSPTAALEAKPMEGDGDPPAARRREAAG